VLSVLLDEREEFLPARCSLVCSRCDASAVSYHPCSLLLSCTSFKTPPLSLLDDCVEGMALEDSSDAVDSDRLPLPDSDVSEPRLVD